MSDYSICAGPVQHEQVIGMHTLNLCRFTLTYVTSLDLVSALAHMCAGNALGWPGRPGAGGWGQGPGDEGEGGLHEMPSAIQVREPFWVSTQC
jgi:hypothetical protein